MIGRKPYFRKAAAIGFRAAKRKRLDVGKGEKTGRQFLPGK